MFFSFGVGMLMLGCAAIGWIPLDEQRDVGMILIGFVFPLELVATIFRVPQPRHARSDDARPVHDLVAGARLGRPLVSAWN